MNRREKKEREAKQWVMICGNCGSDNYRTVDYDQQSMLWTYRCNACGNEWMER